MRKQIVAIPGQQPARHTSRVVRFGDLVFVAGTTGRDPKTGEMAEDIAGQTRQALENIRVPLEAAGASPSDVLKATCYLADLADKPAFDEVYIPYFSPEPPARACFQVASLGAGVKLEIESIAGIR